MIQTITENLYCAHDGMYMPGGMMHFHLRMTIVKLANGELMLISPIKIIDELGAELDKLGPVRHLVAPNCFHHLHVATAKERYPEAKVYGARGLHRKRKDLNFDVILQDEAPAAWKDEMDQVMIKGAPGMNEIVFYHRASKTLIVTDLVFNIHEYKGLLTGLVLRMVGAHKCVGQSRLWRLITKDRGQAGESVQQLLRFHMERIVMAHGDIYEGDVNASLKQGCRWMLGAAAS